MSKVKSRTERGKPGSGPRAATARSLGSAASAKKARKRKHTERTMLQNLVEMLNKDEQTLAQIFDSLITRAKDGDHTALEFIGKYMLGSGKVSLDEIHNPPVIRKGRR